MANMGSILSDFVLNATDLMHDDLILHYLVTYGTIIMT